MSAELAGRMNERVTIAAPAARDAAGAAVADPAVGTPLWAAVEAEAAPFGSDAERLAAPPRYRITMRAEAAPKVGDRLRWRGQSLVVLAMVRDPRRPDRVELRAEARP